MTRSVVVTGALGLLGTYVAAELLESADVLVVVTPNTVCTQIDRVRRRLESLLDTAGRSPDEMNKVVEVTRKSDIRATLGGPPDQVWNIGAATSYQPHDMPSGFDHVNSTMDVLAATRPAERFFHVSTVGVTGPGNAGRHELVPEGPWWRVETVNPYVVSKLLSEHMVDNWQTAMGTPASVVRPGSLIGPARGRLLMRSRAGYFALLDMVARANRQGRTLAIDVDPRYRPPIVHVDDLARVCGRLSALAADGVKLDSYYHVTGGQRLSNAEQVAAMNRAAATEAVTVGPPATSLDGAFARVNADNIAFMNSGYVFDAERLARVLPPGGVPVVTPASFEKFARDMLGPAAGADAVVGTASRDR
jgi:nucleoside-diphosphate-sugar epimerase